MTTFVAPSGPTDAVDDDERPLGSVPSDRGGALGRLGRTADRAAAWRPQSTRRLLVLLVVLFAVTRLFAGAVADRPMAYGDPQIDPGNDLVTYEGIARDTLDGGQTPYGDLGISYPPGALTVIDAPYLAAPLADVSYRTAFIVGMVLVDALGLLLLVLIARRSDFWQGAVAWVLIVPLLGPVVYTRFDLLPAVLTIWAVERAAAGRWRAAGAFLGASVLTKVYAVFVLPQAFLIAPRRRQVLIGAVIGAAVMLVAFVPQAADLVASLVSDQGQRGLHWESTWGSMVLVAHAFGYPAVVVTAYGAVDVESSVSSALGLASTLITLGVVVVTARRCVQVVRRGSAPGLAVSMFGTMALLLGLGSVYSPQYVLWALAFGVAALALAPRSALPAFTALAAVVVLSHLVYPVLWRGLSTGEPLSLAVLVLRNALTLVAGALALRALPEVDAPTATEAAGASTEAIGVGRR